MTDQPEKDSTTIITAFSVVLLMALICLGFIVCYQFVGA